MIPETVTLTARRNVPFAEQYDFADETEAPIDFTGCTATMQVRLYGNAPGDPLIDLHSVGADVEGVNVNDPATGSVTVRIDQTTLAAMPTGNTPNAADIFSYDLIITWPDGFSEAFMEGRFILKPGVTL